MDDTVGLGSQNYPSFPESVSEVSQRIRGFESGDEVVNEVCLKTEEEDVYI